MSPALAKALEEGFGYRTVRDLLEHYPRRYLTRGELTDLAHAKKGAEVTLVGTVRNLAKKQPRRNLRILEVRVVDDSGAWVCTWFNQPWHAQKLHRGHGRRLLGQARLEGRPPRHGQPRLRGAARGR